MRAHLDAAPRRAFTLLEMVVALMVTAMIVFTIYRFVSAHLAVISGTMEIGTERDAMNTVIKLVQSQLDALPVVQTATMIQGGVTPAAPLPAPGTNAPVAGNVPNIASQNAALQSTALTGKAYKFHGLSNDQMTWTCTAGTGLLTTAAPGEFQVTLTVQPVDDSSNETELGLRRQPAPGNKIKVDLKRGSGADRYDWLPLIRPMAMLEIRYYDQAGNSWSDQWTDISRRPALVRLRLQKHPDDAPVEAVIGIPSAQSVR